MNTDNAIEVKDVYKKFKNYFDKNRSLKEKVLSHNSRQHDYWVLKGMDFYVQKGEAVGLVGRNGCGKSTCLKLLTKIIYPDKGSIQVNGRVSSLLELGAGFHPDLSGMENIYLNATLMGWSRKETDKKLKGIIEFADIGDFIYQPVKTYSKWRNVLPKKRKKNGEHPKKTHERRKKPEKNPYLWNIGSGWTVTHAWRKPENDR